MEFWSTVRADFIGAAVVGIPGVLWAAAKILLSRPQIRIDFQENLGPDTQLFCLISNTPFLHPIFNLLKLQRKEVRVKASVKIRYRNGADYLPEYDSGIPVYFSPYGVFAVLDDHTSAKLILVSDSSNVPNQLIIGDSKNETEETLHIVSGRFLLTLVLDFGSGIKKFEKGLTVSSTTAHWTD